MHFDFAMQPIHIFVYGTLKPDENNYFLCVDRVTSCQRAIAHAALYHLPLNYPTIVPGNAQTYGYLLTFEDQSILEILDEYEQHEPDTIKRFGANNDYQRRKIEIFDLNGKTLGLAWAYLMTLEQVNRLSGIFVPSGVWSEKKAHSETATSHPNR
ncbi:MAG TPA: gamma-glutamylcyclotransferase family protein [Leptolyngbya sp.]|jgi:gamma-glutamylcyclotransferase (GGCT)/AIG2-like uncharacterized protein YtfP|nr:gamma-glutamylcyclotransferase family protein [Leptolyngbya sp.]